MPDITLEHRNSCRPHSSVRIAAGPVPGVVKHKPIFAEETRRGAVLVELKACKNLETGKRLHVEILEAGDETCIYVATALVRMYAKCNSMVDAHQVFERIKQPDVVAWTTLISGYAENGKGVIALDLFAKMQCAPNAFTYVAAIKACTSLALEHGKAECLQRGRELHRESRFESSVYVQNTLIDLYAKCGSMSEAQQVFDCIRNPSVVSWNGLMLGYAENGQGFTAFELLGRMRSQGCVPDSFTFVAALKACTCLALEQDGSRRAECLERGKQIHSEIGIHLNVYVGSALVEMYAKCGVMADAQRAFDSVKHPNVVAWTALILGYAENGEGGFALNLFERMKSLGCAPNSITYVAALKACTSLVQDECGREECLEWGKQLHSEIGCHMDKYVQSTLIDMYAKCGDMTEARKVFDSIKHPNAVSWTALIKGYADNGEGVTALELFTRMKSRGCAPDSFTFVAALKACCLLGALKTGREIHAEVQQTGTQLNAILVSCLVDFYAKCGDLVAAEKVFDSHSDSREISAWNALLAGYGALGDKEAVFGLFKGMQDAGFRPDGVTFLCVLTCCSHVGLVQTAMETFEEMPLKYGVAAGLDHYNCMLDILGRSNKLETATALLRSMPCRPDAVTWTAVLGSCRKWKNVPTGRLAFEALVSLDDTNAAAYVAMAHIYERRGMREEQGMVLGMRKHLKAGKLEGQSCWTKDDGDVHAFRETDYG